MSQPQTMPLAIVMGLSPTGLYAVRELGRAGIDVVGVANTSGVAAKSRYLRQVIVEETPERLTEVLKQIRADCEEAPVLVPTSDHFVEFCTSYSDKLKDHFQLAGVYRDGLAADLLDKEKFYSICAGEQVAYPALHAVDLQQLAGMGDQVSFPAMIKPAQIHRIKHKMAGQKGWIVPDRASFDRIISGIPAEAGTLLVQEIVPGPESDITLYCACFDKAGRAHQVFTARKLRQYPPGFGSASLVQSHAEAETREIAEHLLGQLGYHGIAAAEFKRDAHTGALKIIEINARPSLWFSLSAAAGKKVVLAMYQDLTGRELNLRETPQRNGVRWRYLLKDLVSKIVYARKSVSVLAAPNVQAVGPKVAATYPVFAMDDPWPAFAEIGHFAGQALRRLRAR